jgi:hypothetical protein
MGTELVPETLYSNELTRLCAREDYIEAENSLHTKFTTNQFGIPSKNSQRAFILQFCTQEHNQRNKTHTQTLRSQLLCRSNFATVTTSPVTSKQWKTAENYKQLCNVAITMLQILQWITICFEAGHIACIATLQLEIYM